MQQHPKSELQGWGAPGARRGGWDAPPRRAVPTPACPGMCRPHGDGRSMSRWPHVPAWGRAHTSGGGGGGRAAPHTPGTVPVSSPPGLTATAPQAAATGARWGPVPGSRQPKHAAVALPRRRLADAGEQTEAIPRRAQARWKPGTAGAPATATTPGTGFSGAAGAACLRSCCRAACKQAAAAAATASAPPPTSPGCRHPSACRRGQYSPLHQGKLCRGAGRDGDAGQPCREPGRGSSVARWPVATGNASLMPLLS